MSEKTFRTFLRYTYTCMYNTVYFNVHVYMYILLGIKRRVQSALETILFEVLSFSRKVQLFPIIFSLNLEKKYFFINSVLTTVGKNTAIY